MKRPTTLKFIGAALTGALLLSLVPASEAADRFDLRVFRYDAVVTNAPADPAVPAEKRADFNKRFDEARKAFRAKETARGSAACDAMLKDFATYPSIVRQVRREEASWLARDKATAAKALVLADLLLAEKGRPSQEVEQALGSKYTALKNLSRWEEGLDVLLLLMKQPKMHPWVRYGYLREISWILRDKLGDDKTAALFTESLVHNADLSDAHRAEWANNAGNIYRGWKLQDHAKALACYEMGLTFTNAPAQTRAWLSESLVNSYCRVEPSRFDEAIALATAYVADTNYTADMHAYMLNTLNWRCLESKDKERKLRMVEPVKAFYARHAKELNRWNRDNLRKGVLEAYRRVDRKSPACLAWSQEIAADPLCSPAFRGEQALTVADDLLAKGAYAACETYLTDLLPVITNEPALIGKFLGKTVYPAYVREDADAMRAIYRKAYDYNRTPAMTNAVVRLTGKVYEWFRQYDQAAAYYIANDAKPLAAALYCGELLRDYDKGTKLWEEIINDPASTDGERSSAYGFLCKDPDLGERYFTLALGKTQGTTNAVLSALQREMGSLWEDAFYGRFDEQVRNYALYRKVLNATGKAHDFKAARYAIYAFAAKGDLAKAREICAKYLSEKDGRRKAGETYEIALIGEVALRKGDETGLRAAVAAADKALAGGIPAKDRVKAIEHVGSFAILAKNENLARALSAYKDSLYVPQPKKRYVVRYSEEPILGLSDRDRIAKIAPSSRMDRNYGGSMDFLVTDVSTGNRGAGIAGKKAEEEVARPELSIICDVNGIHFRFECPDERARDIGRRVIGGGSYEGYIAPGENQPHVCFLYDLQKGKLDWWNTTYNTANHHRIVNDEPELYRTQTQYTDTNVVTYIMIAWDAYPTHIPAKGTVWDFENVLWGRKGSFAWNGTKSIHGRSTWGELVFDLPEKGRVEILKRLLFLAKDRYAVEKRTGNFHEGVLDHWKDDEVGDPAFYAAKIQPIVDELDGYAARIKNDMTDAEVLLLADIALPRWANLPYTVARLRADWLEDSLTK